MKFGCLLLNCVLCVLLLMLPSVTAFGVSPASLEFPSVVAGETAESTLFLSNPFAEEWIVQFNASDTFLFIPDELTIARGEPATVRVQLTIPTDTPAGLFTENIRLSYTPKEKGEENYAVIQQWLYIPASAPVASVATTSCILGGVHMSPTVPGGESVLTFSIKNTGTASTNPVIRTTYGEWVEERVRPGETLEGETVFSIQESPGIYTVTIDACGTETFVELVVEETYSGTGTLEFVRINDTDSEITPISAVFRNQGDAIISARLTGVVVDAQEGHVLSVIDGDAVRVLPGQRVTLEEYITVPPGEYFVRVKAFYEGQSSSEQELVYEKKNNTHNNILWYVIMIPIFILVVLILRKRE